MVVSAPRPHISRNILTLPKRFKLLSEERSYSDPAVKSDDRNVTLQICNQDHTSRKFTVMTAARKVMSLYRDIFEPGALTSTMPGVYIPQRVKWEARVAEGVDMALVSISLGCDRDNITIFVYSMFSRQPQSWLFCLIGWLVGVEGALMAIGIEP